MHELMPSVVPMAVSIVTSVWMMIFQVSFFMPTLCFMVKINVSPAQENILCRDIIHYVRTF